MVLQADYAFLHGGGQGSWVWAETIAAMGVQSAGGFGRALALDAPGCGAKRDRATGDITIEDIARELIADIEAQGLREVVLVGHSQAGLVLPRMAGLRPDLFRRLVYVSCVAPRPGQTVMQVVGTGLHGSNPDEVGWPVLGGDPRERLPAMFCNDMAPDEAAGFLAKLGKDNWPLKAHTETDWRYDHLGAVPATYVICLRDMALTAPWQEKFADRFKAERRVRIDVGHQVMNTRPHALAEVLRCEAV